MSGGSMNYLYSKIEYEIEEGLPRTTPQREAFYQHIQKVIQALKDIEWVDSFDMSEGDENEAIAACLNGQTSDSQSAERDQLRAALQRLVDAKDEKDANGDTPRYRELKAGAWEEAREVLRKAPPSE